jgi:hypothetical protein
MRFLNAFLKFFITLLISKEGKNFENACPNGMWQPDFTKKCSATFNVLSRQREKSEQKSKR